MSSTTDILNAWYGSTDEVNRLARDMASAGRFEDGDYTVIGSVGLVIDFFDKPWHWDREHAWWVANEWPDSWQAWERGYDTDYALPAERLEYLRGEIEAERISMTEIIELQGMADSIDPSDVLLLQWAGIPEFSVVASTYEVDDETGEVLYWGNTDGWTVRSGATEFTAEERMTVNLPIDGEWESAE